MTDWKQQDWYNSQFLWHKKQRDHALDSSTFEGMQRFYWHRQQARWYLRRLIPNYLYERAIQTTIEICSAGNREMRSILKRR